ncbi:ankyrin repeat domain-containing protein 63 [Varanus komodoensis]|uniref:ankyrin repeat domain-containing protein 63 n=1 Tax=Varanus komodoensis TaxID=61221 RepID=UPI001CF796B7|nr:ankyrin repeat domain-containing protein 63 [Varanus komodoensis]
MEIRGEVIKRLWGVASPSCHLVPKHHRRKRRGGGPPTMLKPRDLGPGESTRTFLEAMKAGRLHLARFVLDALDGEIVDCRADRGRTPLMYAVLLKDPAWRLAFARLLLERRAAVNMRDDAGRSALSLACERGYLEVTELLVQFGADPDAVDSRGWSPLMYAASQGQTAVIEWLLRVFRRLGLYLERADHAGSTALLLASAGGHSQCVRALRAAGALFLAQPEPVRGGDAAPAIRVDGERERHPDRPRPEEEEGAQQRRWQDAAAAVSADPEAAKEPVSLRVRPLIRRSTAPDCQKLIGC